MPEAEAIPNTTFGVWRLVAGRQKAEPARDLTRRIAAITIDLVKSYDAPKSTRHIAKQPR